MSLLLTQICVLTLLFAIFFGTLTWTNGVIVALRASIGLTGAVALALLTTPRPTPHKEETESPAKEPEKVAPVVQRKNRPKRKRVN